MEIQAAVVRQKDGAFSIEAVEIGEPQPDEVLVKIVASGICHTDLAVCEQHVPLPLPAILGHEGAGVVLEVGANVTEVSVGDHVVLTFASCGACRSCTQARPSYCAEFVPYNASARRPDGSCTHHWRGRPITASFFYQSSFATHAIAHRRNVVKAPRDLPIEALAPLGCGVQTGAGAILNCLKPPPGSSVAVFGAGAVGLSAIMAAQIAHCAKIVAVDLHAARLDLASDLGATHVVNAGHENVAEAIKAVLPDGADFAIEATGLPEVMAQAVEALSFSGTAVLLGVAPSDAKVSLNASTLLSGRVIRSSIEGDSVPSEFIPILIDHYRRGAFPFDRMARYYDFDQINDAVADSRRGSAIKPILRMPA